MVFKLFKNVGLDLVDAFHEGALIAQDVLLLTEDFDGTLPIQNPVIRSTRDLKMLLDLYYNGSWKDLFDAIWSFKGHQDRAFVIYLNREDFCTLVVKYFREVYPAISDEALKKLYYLTTDRIGTTFGFFYNTGKKSALAYRNLAVPDMTLDLIVKRTQNEGIFTDELRATLPMELHFADYLVNGKGSRFIQEYRQALKSIVLDEFRRGVILEIKDGMLARLSEFYKFFPSIEKKATLMETIQDAQFDFLNDLAITQHDGSNCDEDGNDVLYVLQRYGVDYLKRLGKQMRPHLGVEQSWVDSANRFFAEIMIEERAKIITQGDYEQLLDSKKIAWIDTAGIEIRHKLRFNFLLLDYFRTLSAADLKQFDLTGNIPVQTFAVDDLEIVGAISS